MPRVSPRQARARDILTTFIEHHKTRIKQAFRRKNKFKRTLQRMGLTPAEDDLPALEPTPNDSVSLSMLSISTDSVSLELELSSTSESTSEPQDWSDLLGSDWRESSSSSASSADSLFDSSDGDSMPELYPAGYPDSDEEHQENPKLPYRPPTTSIDQHRRYRPHSKRATPLVRWGDHVQLYRHSKTPIVDRSSIGVLIFMGFIVLVLVHNTQKKHEKYDRIHVYCKI
ncbi:hypothetical protein B0H16DRAFT_1462998 [Mycena metata]|uniref:Uncharacterized protein n=1 Tax=Mycena metata TaxID=1033252 RepID=A0AAD7IJU7_9AGAR|nr:hypothetical protein B0H16DRAFT_1462998 [Mycena metata]